MTRLVHSHRLELNLSGGSLPTAAASDDWGFARMRRFDPSNRTAGGRRRLLRAIGSLTLVCAALFIGGVVLAEHVSGRDVAVLRKTLALRENPQLGGETGTTGIIGEVVHIKEVTTGEGATARPMEDEVTIRSAESRLVVERGKIARILNTTNAPAKE